MPNRKSPKGYPSGHNETVSTLALLAVALLAAPLLAAAGAAGKARVTILSPEALAARLGEVTVLDARDGKAFRAGHVPGSQNVDWKDFTLERPGAWSYVTGDPARWGKVPPADEALAKRLRELGLSNGRLTVVVGEPGAWGEEGRIAWNLLYWGARDVALLDGGFAAWRGAVETGAAREPRPGTFRVTEDAARRVELPALAAIVKARSRPLLDARTPEEFQGEKMTGQKRGGHLPGARLVAVKSLNGPDGRYVNSDELRRLAGPGIDSRVPVTYCTGGVRSALLAVLLEARLGIVAQNYDGSIWEWSARPELPMTGGAE